VEKEISIFTISSLAVYEADKITFNDRCTTFDISWYLITAAASILKLMYSPRSDFLEALVFMMLFVVPIGVKHLLALDVYKGIRDSLSGTKRFNFINITVNIVLFASILGLLLLALVNTIVEYNDTIQYILITIHVLIALVGIYDRITVKINPKFESREGEEFND